MASKKLLFPDPFLPTITLWPAEKGSISLWLRKLRKPLITSCLICMPQQSVGSSITDHRRIGARDEAQSGVAVAFHWRIQILLHFGSPPEVKVIHPPL